MRGKWHISSICNELVFIKTDFPSDKLLLELANGMDYEWVNVCLLMGLTYDTVKDFIQNKSLSLADMKFKVRRSILFDCARIRFCKII